MREYNLANDLRRTLFEGSNDYLLSAWSLELASFISFHKGRLRQILFLGGDRVLISEELVNFVQTLGNLNI